MKFFLNRFYIHYDLHPLRNRNVLNAYSVDLVVDIFNLMFPDKGGTAQSG